MRYIISLIFRILSRLRRELVVIVGVANKYRFSSCGGGLKLRNPRSIIGGKYIRIGRNFDCFPGLRIEAFDFHLNRKYSPAIIIGDDVGINYDCHIGCVNKIVIGNKVVMGSRVYITDHGHGAPDYHDIDVPPTERKVVSKGPVIIEDSVWIGEGACILPGVRIGRHAIIGANAVVTRDVLPYTIVGGVPAVLLKTLSFSELSTKLNAP